MKYVHALVSIDSEYGHKDLVAIYRSHEEASAALSFLTRHRHRGDFVEISREVFGVSGGLTFEDLEVVKMPIMKSFERLLERFDGPV